VTASAQACAFEVSVVIPCLNRVDFLCEALSSVYKQSLAPTEVIVIDDGSPRSLKEKLADIFPEIRWYRQENKGVSAARNLGARKAQYPWIAFLDSDDQWQPDKLKKQSCFHHENVHILASHTNEIWVRNGNQVIPPKYLDKSPEQLFQRSLVRCLICPSSVILHRSIFEQFEGFDESLPVCEDYDLWLRILMQKSFGYIDKKLVIKNGGHDDQLSRQVWGMDRFRVQSLEKLVKTTGISSSNKEAILCNLVQKCKVLSAGFRKHNKEKEAKMYLQKSLQYKNLLPSFESV
jgi:glycosyltransferase involved in cell wall biosynthesis